MTRALALIALLAGCAHPGPVPPAPPPIETDLADCPAGTQAPRDVDNCEGKSTPEGFQCVSCLVQKGCRYRAAEVYCTPACADPYCGLGARRR